MRVCIGFVRHAMGGPPCVANAAGALQRAFAQTVFQIAQLARRAAAFNNAAFNRGNASGIISTIFKAAQRLNNVECYRLISQNANNATHIKLLYFFLGGFGRLFDCPIALGPTFFNNGGNPRHGQRIGGHIGGDHT